jgi:hypothetical protein
MRKVMPDKRFQPQCKYDPRASGISRSQAVQGDLECLTLEDGKGKSSRNVGN